MGYLLYINNSEVGHDTANVEMVLLKEAQKKE